VTGPRLLRQVPRLTGLVMAIPVLAGLAGTLVPALTGPGLERLMAWPGLPGAVWLSVVTGLSATLISLALVLLIAAGLHGTPAFGWIGRLLAPVLSLPHAAAALGLAFLIAPSGWIARGLSPWATGWEVPPDLLTLNDPAGLALIAGLVLKEVPFLLLMLLAALPQADAARRMMLARTLGYGRVRGFVLTVWPALYPQMRLPVLAVLTYSMTAVEPALILGPGLPPTLSAQVVIWMNAADLQGRGIAAAGALLQLGLVLAVLAIWFVAERLAGLALRQEAGRGARGRGADAPAALLARVAGLALALTVAAALAGLALWSVAGPWPFPKALPEVLTLATWSRALPDLVEGAGVTMAIALGATGLALAFVLGCLEAEHRHGLSPGPSALWLLYLPLLMPQVAFLPGLQMLFLQGGITGGVLAVMLMHLVFVLPYVFLSLSAPWRAWDRRLATAGAALGASPARVFWRLRLPMLLAPVLTAAAVGAAVSIGQYLPTLVAGGGRVETVTTAAVALASGGNRRLIGAYGLLQMVLPALGFVLALALPALVWRNRCGMRVSA
jgi:putative thiamine transport system permease protein